MIGSLHIFTPNRICETEDFASSHDETGSQNQVCQAVEDQTAVKSFSIVHYKCCSLVRQFFETQEKVSDLVQTSGSPFNTIQDFCTHQKKEHVLYIILTDSCIKMYLRVLRLQEQVEWVAGRCCSLEVMRKGSVICNTILTFSLFLV